MWASLDMHVFNSNPNANANPQPNQTLIANHNT